MTDDSLINNPDADRLIHGLRDTGYNFNTAATDIIDNSIAAGAKHVDVLLDMDTEGRKIVSFADDGHGMTADELHGAMRYGAPVRANLASLGITWQIRPRAKDCFKLSLSTLHCIEPSLESATFSETCLGP